LSPPSDREKSRETWSFIIVRQAVCDREEALVALVQPGK
jgi:hypothetical protein